MIDGRVLDMVGPVAARFFESRAFLAGIIGPVGSGKTITCCQKLLAIAVKQKPRVRKRDGLKMRKARIGVIRDTYPNLDANVLSSWFKVVPEERGKFVWDAPRRHNFRVILATDPRTGAPTDVCDVEAEFRAIGDKSVEAVTRGWEINAAWVNEYDTAPGELLSYLSGRVGRFSDLDPRLVVDPQIIVDLNMPDIDNHAYKTLIDEDFSLGDDPELLAALNGRPLVETFLQPGAREPGAENLRNLPPGYYALQIALNKSKRNYIDRMIDNKPVPLQHGQPVYPEFNFHQHLADVVEYDPSRTLIVGMDAGLTPAAVFVQRDSLGQLRVLAELCVFPEGDEALSGVGPTRFGQAVARFIAERFPSIQLERKPVATLHRIATGSGGASATFREFDREKDIEFWCDPSAKDGTDKSGNEKSWLQIVSAQIHRPIKPARTNQLHVRLEAVRRPMVALIDGQHPGFVMAKECKVLRRGFVAGYHYQRVAVGGDGTGRFDSEPRKNMFSHVQDALQYAAMADGAAVAEILGKQQRKGRAAARAAGRGGANFGNGYFSGG